MTRRVPYNPRQRQLARGLRRRATFPERLLWSRLRRRQLGVRFLRQRPLGHYVADFFAPDADLVVEVDGRSHDADRADHDTRRQAWLERQGFHVVRFQNDEVLQDVEGVVEQLRRWLEEHGHGAP